MSRYNVIKPIAETEFSFTYLGLFIENQHFVAIKVHKHDPYATPKERSQDIIQFQREALFLKQISSPYVVKLLDHGIHKGNFFLVMEYIPGLTLKAYKDVKGPLNEETTIRFGKDIFLGLKDIHGAGIISRDVKPLNLIYNSHVTHIDLGIAKKAGQNTRRNIKHCYTLFFAPSEMRIGEGSFITTDIYASCATLLFLMTDPALSETDLEHELGKNITAKKIRKLRPSITGKFASFLARGMQHDPRKRWSSAEIAYTELCSL